MSHVGGSGRLTSSGAHSVTPVSTTQHTATAPYIACMTNELATLRATATAPGAHGYCSAPGAHGYCYCPWCPRLLPCPWCPRLLPCPWCPRLLLSPCWRGSSRGRGSSGSGTSSNSSSCRSGGSRCRRRGCRRWMIADPRPLSSPLPPPTCRSKLTLDPCPPPTCRTKLTLDANFRRASPLHPSLLLGFKCDV